ncbi:n-acetylglutamate synthase [Larkinella rosea]|uniref:N-acetylglutamate synthase n=2 Tax=Larkinella rosea TaxID=2025312 RepID=A0A3P1C4M2_9BACT|nr:n-acetylglutamate synthase [Larkinella rosea]
MYDQKIFGSVANTDNGEVGSETRFWYHQEGEVVWAEYRGGSVVKGFLVAKILADNALDMVYQHLNTDGEFRNGVCHSTPEWLPDGRIRLHERWRWTNGDGSEGASIIEEIA